MSLEITVFFIRIVGNYRNLFLSLNIDKLISFRMYSSTSDGTRKFNQLSEKYH